VNKKQVTHYTSSVQTYGIQTHANTILIWLPSAKEEEEKGHEACFSSLEGGRGAEIARCAVRMQHGCIPSVFSNSNRSDM
jgi:hypothetical protein